MTQIHATIKITTNNGVPPEDALIDLINEHSVDGLVMEIVDFDFTEKTLEKV